MSFFCLGQALPAMLFIGIGHVDCSSRLLAGVLLCLAMGLLAVNTGSVLVNVFDIAPDFAGVIMTVDNTIATLPGIVVPYIVTHMTPNVR
jgi:ACS family sodium-dependent inorganic phosphate cotransporter-like MFS transporter 5